MRSIVENQIRLTLSSPPGRACEDERREVYVASLLVFLELLDAARGLEYLARPLPLFYAVSQAGRAIVAAHGAQPRVRGHGLTEHAIREPITLTTIAPQTSPGLFGTVAEALASPALHMPVELGALWSAIPDLADTPHGDGRWPPALPMFPDTPEIILASLPLNGLVGFPDPVAAAAHEDLDGYLSHYPDAATAQVMRLPGLPGQGFVTRPTPRGDGVPLVFFDHAVEPNRPAHQVNYTSHVPEHRFAGERWLVPSVGGAALPPLLLWWSLLFGLSILARYEPAVWRSALDIETPLAVPLEDLLDEALEAVPHWILWALTGSELRTNRPT